ncbi:MAG: T9SS C-terminal target domain-containing protein, partial [Bacteroidales bacterium]
KTSSPFAVNLNTGVVTVNNSTLLDYETIHSYTVTIRVSDGIHSADGVFTINLNNLNDNSPVVTDATFAIDENSANSTAVGTVVATDADGTLNSLTYSITSGNTNNAFAINSATGAITINKTEEINFEVTPVFNLTVTASDGTLSGNANVRINLNDVVETGIDDNKSFSIKVYPNPAVDMVSVSLDHLSTGSYTIEVLSIIGNKVYQREVNTPFEIQIIDLTGFAEGIYFVKAYNKQFSFTERLVIH